VTHDLVTLLDRFAGLSVVVVGEAMLDVDLEGHATGLCREAPVPVVALRRRRHAPGGAANTAANLAALGASVSLVSAVGDDAEGDVLVQALEQAGVDISSVLVRPRSVTIAKQRVVADGQIVARLDQGAGDGPDVATESALVASLRDQAGGTDAVVVSDNGAGLMTPVLRQAVAEVRAKGNGLLVVDARDPGAYRDAAPLVVKPNYDEAVRLLGARRLDPGPARAEQIQAGSEELLARTGARLVCVTLDADGALLLEAGQPPYRTYARAVAHPRVSGAGDTFVSALTLALAAGGAPRAAVELAEGAAEVVVVEPGTTTCGAPALRQHVAGADKTLTLAGLAERVGAHRRAGRRIVFTNGCFDLLHRGHVGYLSRAKALGDVLVVGVNSDGSVRRLKGGDRPVCADSARVRVLSALSCIDHVVVFDEDSPREIIEEVRPDVYVKGGDYSRERLPEAAQVERLGGTLHFLPYEDESTTSIIDRIRTGAR
jgi:D-beta-D-heptose 7-phosphate kinase/D-beta-D-heptose 1-phosphate adenosyltransferase